MHEMGFYYKGRMFAYVYMNKTLMDILLIGGYSFDHRSNNLMIFILIRDIKSNVI